MMNRSSNCIQLDSSLSIGRNRVKSMVNRFNAAVSSSRPTVPSTMSGKRTSVTSSSINPHRPVCIESAAISTRSTPKPTMTSANRPSLQRAMTINNNSPVTSTSQTTDNNLSSTYKRK